MEAKIICTIGPSSIDKNILQLMKINGMSIGRVNTKYGDENQWNEIVNNLRELKIDVLIDIKSDKYIDWVKTINPDYLAVSFAETVSQLKQYKIILKDTKIIAKIESEKGFKNFKNLLKYSSGMMVARGDLSRSVSLEKVPSIQRKILAYCNSQKKMSIVATEMLLSMVEKKYPTNAEVNDVYMASILKASCVMLSEETAVGRYPDLAVMWMSKILNESKRK